MKETIYNTSRFKHTPLSKTEGNLTIIDRSFDNQYGGKDINEQARFEDFQEREKQKEGYSHKQRSPAYSSRFFNQTTATNKPLLEKIAQNKGISIKQ